MADDFDDAIRGASRGANTAGDDGATKPKSEGGGFGGGGRPLPPPPPPSFSSLIRGAIAERQERAAELARDFED